MQTNRHLLFFYLFLLCSFACYSQEPSKEETPKFPVKETKLDTNTTQEKTISSFPKDIKIIKEGEEENNSIRSSKKEGLLTDIVDYYGEDYVYIDRKAGKIYMYNKAYINYEDYKINAGLIILDYNKNEIYAAGVDSLGSYSQSPVFIQGSNTIEPDSIRFNFDTKKSIIYNAVTKQAGNGIATIAEVAKKENDSVYYFSNVRFTTSENTEDPEYYFLARKAKFVPKQKIVTGLVNMYIADVPTPIGLPFGFFPLTEDRASGFIIPNIGENNNRGFFFQNGGYYFAINDYVDLALLGDYYTNGSYGLRADSNYSLRYRFRGNLSIRFENLINGERGFSDFSESSLYNIRWSHSQDAKANPSARFSASVNLGSSRFLQQSINQTNNASQLVNTLSSSVSYSKSFETKPQISYTVAATHNQNTRTEEINLSLPNFNGSISRIFPFAPKSGVKKGAIQNINLQYNVTGENRIRTTDSLFFTPAMFDNSQLGARHSIPISTNFKVLDYLSVSAGANYDEVWVGKTFRENFDPTLNEGQGGVIRDTVGGFDAYRTYSFGTGVGTTLYGQYSFKKEGKIEAIRHVVRPSISYNISPSFDQFYDNYTLPSADPEINSQEIEFSRFQETLFGAPNNRFSSNIGINISNTLEAKVRSKDTTATTPKKVTILNNLNFSSGYNIAADSLQWSPVRFTAGIPIIKDLDLNVNGSLDPYTLNDNNRRIDRFNIDNGGGLFRLTGANVSFNYSFSSDDFKNNREGNSEEENFNSDTFRNGGRPDDLFGETPEVGATNVTDRRNTSNAGETPWYSYKIPWSLRVAYTLTYNNTARQNEITSQSLMFSSNVDLSPRWSVRISSGYDFVNQGVTLTQFSFVRDLESWNMRFSWTPIGAINTSWNFFIGIKGSILSDIKYDKRREADRRF